MQLQLNRIRCRVSTVSFTPVVADSVGEDVSVLGEASGGDGATDFGIAFEAVLGVLVPEVEGTVATGGAEGAMLGVEGDCVDGVDFGDVPGRRVLLSVAFEGEV